MPSESESASQLVLLFTPPYEVMPALATLAAHAIPGSEETDREARTHTRLLPGALGPAAVTVQFNVDRVTVTSTAGADIRGLEPLVRHWLDLDADAASVSGSLQNDPVIGSLVRARPGLRVLGYPNGFEAAVTTVLGQQVSVAACRTFAGRLTAEFGVAGPQNLTVFPTAERLAAATPEELQRAVGLTGARSRTLHALAEACAAGLRIEPDSDHVDVRRRLLALPGIGPWSADYLAVRALGDRDGFVPGDLVLRRALGGISAKAADAASHAWSPHRAYALFQLWTSAAYAA